MDTLVGTTTISKLFYLPSEKGLLFGANSFLIGQTHFQKRFYTPKSKQEVTKFVSLVQKWRESYHEYTFFLYLNILLISCYLGYKICTAAVNANAELARQLLSANMAGFHAYAICELIRVIIFDNIAASVHR